MPGQASHIWLCDEASGDLVDEVAGLAFEPQNSPLYQRQAVGLWDGSSIYGKKAVETPYGAGSQPQFTLPDSGDLDYDGSTSFAFLVVYRTTSALTANSSRLLFKMNGGVGYQLRQNSGGFAPSIDDGTNSDSFNVGVGSLDDGAWHAVLWVVDRNADLMGCYTDVEGNEQSGLTATGSLSNASLLQFMSHAASGWGGQAAYLAAWTGSAAEGLGQTHLDNFWKSFQDPSGKLTTYSRASLFSDIVGEDGGDVRIAHYSGEPSTPQVALGWHTNLTLGQGFGLRASPVITNECPESEDIANGWTASSASVTADDGDAPDGFRSADLVTQTGSDGLVKITVSGLTESTQYHFSTYADSDGQGAKTGSIEVWDSGESTQRAQSDMSLASTWGGSSHGVTYTTQAGETSVVLYLNPEKGASAGRAHFWAVQVNEGDFRQPYVRTAGAAASTVAIDARIDNSGGDDILKSNQGEIELTHLYDIGFGGSSTWPLDTAQGASGEDRITIRNEESVPRYRHSLKDNAGSEVHEVIASGEPTLDTEYVVAVQYNEDGDVLGTGDAIQLLINGVREGGGGAPFTRDLAATTIYLGQDNGNANQGLDLQSRLRIYDKPKTEAA